MLSARLCDRESITSASFQSRLQTGKFGNARDSPSKEPHGRKTTRTPLENQTWNDESPRSNSRRATGQRFISSQLSTPVSKVPSETDVYGPIPIPSTAE